MCSKVGCTVIILLFNMLTISECLENQSLVKTKKQLENYQMLGGEIDLKCVIINECLVSMIDRMLSALQQLMLHVHISL